MGLSLLLCLKNATGVLFAVRRTQGMCLNTLLAVHLGFGQKPGAPTGDGAHYLQDGHVLQDD